jgi:hypothetical protein
LNQALKDAHLAMQQIRQAYRKLQLDKNAMEAVQPRRKTQAAKNPVPEELAQHTERIALLGRKYGTFVEPWVESSMFGEPLPSIEINSLERYRSAQSKKLGRIAELYDFIPPGFHESMNRHSYFASTVSPRMMLMHAVITYRDEIVYSRYEQVSGTSCQTIP